MSVVSRRLVGVESFAYYMAKKYKDYDIMVLCRSGDINQLERIREFCPAQIWRGEKIDCEQMIINCDTYALDYLEHGEVTMVVHADYSQPCYKQFPNFTHPKITRIVGITKYICKMMKDKFNIDCELSYNPLVVEKKTKPIIIVSATRLSAIKGGWRMQKIADELTRQNVDFIWYIFTVDNDCIFNDNVIFMKPRLDVYRWIAMCDLFIQVSTTEASSYSIDEALSYGKQVVVTPLPYLNEKGIVDGENAIVLNFDCSNIENVVERMKKPRKVTWKCPADNYENILCESTSHYDKGEKRMKRIRVKQKFLDMKHNNMLRKIGEEFLEDDVRADDLVNRGFAEIVPEPQEQKETKKEQVVETATKPEPKKEKAVRKNAKKS